MKKLINKIICSIFGHRPDDLENKKPPYSIWDFNINREWTCIRCGYHNARIEWPRPLPKNNES